MAIIEASRDPERRVTRLAVKIFWLFDAARFISSIGSGTSWISDLPLGWCSSVLVNSDRIVKISGYRDASEPCDLRFAIVADLGAFRT